jgi:hypothetical protein
MTRINDEAKSSARQVRPEHATGAHVLVRAPAASLLKITGSRSPNRSF